MVEVDSKDKKILYQLDLNARQSDASIARKVGLSKYVVNYRIKKLLEKKIIRYFYTMVDASKFGYLSCRLFIKFQYDNPEKEKEMVNFFMSKPYAWWVPTIEGQRDLAVIVWAKNTYQFYEIIREVLAKYKPFIKDYIPGIYARFYQYKRAYLAGLEKDESEPVLTCFDTLAEFDDTDIKLLKIIAAEARMPTVEIADKLDITPETVRNRINGLIKKRIVQGFRPALDLKKLGYRWYKLVLDLEDISKKKDILKFAQNHPNVVYAYEVIGGHDIELELEVESYEKFKEIMHEIRHEFSEAIRYFDYFLVWEEHRILYMPMTI